MTAIPTDMGQCTGQHCANCMHHLTVNEQKVVLVVLYVLCLQGRVIQVRDLQRHIKAAGMLSVGVQGQCASWK